jgi:hypothetical protein
VCVPEQFADNWETESAAGPDTGERVAQMPNSAFSGTRHSA